MIRPVRSLLAAWWFFGLSLAMAPEARGQYFEPPIVPEPPPEPGAATPAPPGASSEAAAPDTAARLDEVDQLARIADRNRELFEEELARRETESPVVGAGDEGFSLRSASGAYLLRLRALLQVDGRFFVNDDPLQAGDTFFIRRFRPALDGTLFSVVDYRLVPDFAGGAVAVLDAYVDVHPWPWLRLRVGKFKGPIGLERLQSDADLPLLERSLDQNLSSQREIGVQLWGDVAGGVVQYTLALVNGSVDGTAGPDADMNHAKDLAGRLFFQPFRAPSLRRLGALGFGVAASIGNRKGRLPAAVSGSPVPTTAAVTGLPAFRTAGGATFFQYLAPATDTNGAATVFSYELESHLNPQIFYYYENIGVLAEYLLLRQGVQRTSVPATLTNQAAHVTLSYVLGGRVGWDGVTPTVPFQPRIGALGAWEIAARWAWLKVDVDAFGTPGPPATTQYADPTKSALEARSWTGGLTWIPRRSVHLALNFEQTYFRGGAGTVSAPADRKTENVFIGRAQVNF